MSAVAADPIRWDVPGPYTVAFSTRAGGVSTGPYDSLNLGVLTADDPDSVVENRRRLCAAIGADPERATMARQVHGGRVVRSSPTGVVTPGPAGIAAYDECDGLWTSAQGEALLLLGADCALIALARTSPADGPALAVLHAGWRGLLAGIVEHGVRSLGGGPHAGAARLAAAIGPAIGPCCYEVGEDVAEPFRAAFGKDIVRDGRLDLPTAVERALRTAGVSRVHRVDLCTACHPELFFSHRRDAGVTGRQGVIGIVG